MVRKILLILVSSVLLSWTSAFGQTARRSSLEAVVYEAEAVLVCTVDKVQWLPEDQDEIPHAVLSLNPIKMLKGKIDRGATCVATIFDEDEAKILRSWVDDKEEFILPLQRLNGRLEVQNQRDFFHGSSRDSKEKLFSYWHEFKRQPAVSMAQVIKDIEAFLETEKSDPATAMGVLSRGASQIRFPANQKLNRFAQRALRQQLSAEEIRLTSNRTRGPIQMERMASFDLADKEREVEWLARSEVGNLSKSDENIELLKSLLADTPIEFGRTEYRDDGDTITVYRRFQVRAEIQAKLASFGVIVDARPVDDEVWSRPKHPVEYKLLKELGGPPEVYFELDPFNPPKEFTRVKKMFLRGGRWKKIPDLSGFEELEMLKCEHTYELADISELPKLKRLRYLDVAYSNLSDISPLREIKNLDQLDLRGTKVADLAPLSELSKLEILNISGTAVKDLSPLKGLKNLKMLYGGPEKLDMAPLKELTDLQHWFGG